MADVRDANERAGDGNAGNCENRGNDKSFVALRARQADCQEHSTASCTKQNERGDQTGNQSEARWGDRIGSETIATIDHGATDGFRAHMEGPTIVAACRVDSDLALLLGDEVSLAV